MRLHPPLARPETGTEPRAPANRQTRVLLFNALCFAASRVFYVKRPGIISLILQIYFGINSTYLLTFQAITLVRDMLRDVLRDLKGNQPAGKHAESKPDSATKITVIKPEQKVKAPSESSTHPVHIQASIPGGAALRGIFPSTRGKTKHTTKSETFEVIRSKESKQRHRITQQIEKDFRAWVHANIIAQAATSTASLAVQLEAAPLTHEEKECVILIGRNGYICYDKGNYTHNKALFKTIYNYFNSILPRSVSTRSNPMDEYLFTDLQKKGGVGVYGLLVEDARSSVLSEEVFRVYFRYKNTLFDAEGDVILSFLFLIMHANIHTGEYLGALSLRAVGLAYGK